MCEGVSAFGKTLASNNVVPNDTADQGAAVHCSFEATPQLRLLHISDSRIAYQQRQRSGGGEGEVQAALNGSSRQSKIAQATELGHVSANTSCLVYVLVFVQASGYKRS